MERDTTNTQKNSDSVVLKTQEELFVEQHLPKNNKQYRVPIGYFATLEKRLMEMTDNAEMANENVPQHAKSSLLTVHFGKKRIWASAAAVALVLGASTLLYFQRDSANLQSTDAEFLSMSDADDDYYDKTVDYLLIDNDDIYTYLAYE